MTRKPLSITVFESSETRSRVIETYRPTVREYLQWTWEWWVFVAIVLCVVVWLTFRVPVAGHAAEHAVVEYGSVTVGKAEKLFQKAWCEDNGGQAEYRLPDGTRCDCVTDKYAVEIEFAHKWKEAIGQALHYARQTGRQAAIVLLVTRESDAKYLRSLMATIIEFNLPIAVEVMWAGGN